MVPKYQLISGFPVFCICSLMRGSVDIGNCIIRFQTGYSIIYDILFFDGIKHRIVVCQSRSGGDRTVRIPADDDLHECIGICYAVAFYNYIADTPCINGKCGTVRSGDGGKGIVKYTGIFPVLRPYCKCPTGTEAVVFNTNIFMWVSRCIHMRTHSCGEIFEYIIMDIHSIVRSLVLAASFPCKSSGCRIRDV